MKNTMKTAVVITKKPEEQRPFTLDSDIIILQMLVEDKATAVEIAVMLGRDAKLVAERIKYLKESGRLQKIHKMLIARKGLYAMKYMGKKRQAV